MQGKLVQDQLAEKCSSCSTRGAGSSKTSEWEADLGGCWQNGSLQWGLLLLIPSTLREETGPAGVSSGEQNFHTATGMGEERE